jgi:hypothetical protein
MQRELTEDSSETEESKKLSNSQKAELRQEWVDEFVSGLLPYPNEWVGCWLRDVDRLALEFAGDVRGIWAAATAGEVEGRCIGSRVPEKGCIRFGRRAVACITQPGAARL